MQSGPFEKNLFKLTSSHDTDAPKDKHMEGPEGFIINFADKQKAGEAFISFAAYHENSQRDFIMNIK